MVSGKASTRAMASASNQRSNSHLTSRPNCNCPSCNVPAANQMYIITSKSRTSKRPGMVECKAQAARRILSRSIPKQRGTSRDMAGNSPNSPTPPAAPLLLQQHSAPLRGGTSYHLRSTPSQRVPCLVGTGTGGPLRPPLRYEKQPSTLLPLWRHPDSLGKCYPAWLVSLWTNCWVDSSTT
ncbi:hypothetical protein CCMA1212_005628 [Trichoderma ghanense]|uniref:Uncharacterized protein n=1 Tax=Trichoderma ghanense TaxID=65468 RepID=A0ABY2H4E7_9HYPO